MASRGARGSVESFALGVSGMHMMRCERDSRRSSSRRDTAGAILYNGAGAESKSLFNERRRMTYLTMS